MTIGRWVLDGHEPRLVSWSDGWKDDRRVAKDQVGDISISTVFLGVDHGWGDGPPILFETMVFGGPMDEYQWRYSTWDEAVAGHARVVDAVREERVLDD